MHRLVFAAILLPCVLGAQAILQHSLAVGVGATAGTVMGKQVSNALNAVRTAEELAAGEAPDPAIRKKKDEWKRLATGANLAAAPAAVAPVSAVGNAKAAATAPAARSRTYSARAAVRPSPSNGGTMWFSAPIRSAADWSQTPPPPPEPDVDALRAMTVGTARDAVVDTLGTPSARVTIPENGRFVEVYYYHAKGESLGAVRLADGAVTEVQFAR